MQDATTPNQPEISATDAPRAHRRGWRLVSNVVDWLKTLSLALVLFIVVRALFIEAFTIPTGSMEGTLLVGDFLLVNKLVYGAEIPLTHKHLPALRAPERGEIVVFTWPVDPSKNFVKRIVGIAGDTLEMKNGALVRNGATITEGYVHHTQPGTDPGDDGEFGWQAGFLATPARATPRSYHPSRNNWGPILVPPHQYFVLGDNRDNSLDSRYWGFLPDSLIRGRPLFVYYSYAPDSVTALDWLTRIRWTRLLTRIE